MAINRITYSGEFLKSAQHFAVQVKKGSTRDIVLAGNMWRKECTLSRCRLTGLLTQHLCFQWLQKLTFANGTIYAFLSSQISLFPTRDYQTSLLKNSLCWDIIVKQLDQISTCTKLWTRLKNCFHPLFYMIS